MSTRLRELLLIVRRSTPATVGLAGVALTLVLLLLNRPGIAIVAASLVIPIIALSELPRRDVHENEPRWSSPAMLGWGAVIGILTGALAAVVASSWWVDGAALHVGAAGFGGAAAEAEGRPGFGVLLINGIVLAVAAVALAALGPYYLRRYPVFRNEAMDGITLGIAAGGGLATGTAIVYIWPLVDGESPTGYRVSDWTAMLLGLLVTRPIIFGLLVALVCAGVWMAAMSQETGDLVVPLATGLGGAVAFSVGDMLLQPAGTRWELLWHLVVIVGLAAVASPVFRRGLRRDRALLSATDGTRVVCPECRSLTPKGLYCASCGATLPSAESTMVEPAEAPA